MASLLRQIVAGPRSRHPEAGLDLCYVTDNIIATSGPSHTYPKRAYRNPLDRLVAFLDEKHGKDWAIWEFRAEGTGYPDHLVYNRIRHYPWPDHHPPPFRLVPMIMASMRNWLNGNDLHDEVSTGTGAGTSATEEETSKAGLMGKVVDALKDKKGERRVIVVHCKAGKGRSGTMACSYLISQCGWAPEEALARFTERRMRPKFGPGVSIPSQLRWIGYVDRWTKSGKKYVDREIEVVEVHVWGLRSGVKILVEGFAEEGKKIKAFHTFTKKERLIIEGDAPGSGGVVNQIRDVADSPNARQEVLEEAKEGDTGNGTAAHTQGLESNGAAGNSLNPAATDPLSGPKKSRTSKLIDTISRNSSTGSLRGKNKKPESNGYKANESNDSRRTSTESLTSPNASDEAEPGGRAVILKPTERIRIPNSDVNISMERRNRAPASMGLTMVTSVAHVWFNTYFEGNGPEQDGNPDLSGVFEIEWEKMDGIKGSSQKGTRAADRIAVVWRSIAPEGAAAHAGKQEAVQEPSMGSPVPQMRPADWKGTNEEDQKKLGLRVQSPDSADVSEASSIRDVKTSPEEDDSKSIEIEQIMEGVKSALPGRRRSIFGRDKHEDDSTGTESSKGHSDPSLEAYADKLPDPEGSGSNESK